MEERTIDLPSLASPSDVARIVVVADTHSRPDARADSLIVGLAPVAILHAGDIGDLAVLDRLAALVPASPLHAVRGNIDVHAPEVPESLVLSLRRDGAELMRFVLTHIAVAGPRLTKAARTLALEARADGVVCGHSHVPFVSRDVTKAASLAVFNPGSIGPRRFGLPIVFGVIEVGARLSFRHIDVETGRTWTPQQGIGGPRSG